MTPRGRNNWTQPQQYARLERAIAKLDRAEQARREAHDAALEAVQAYARDTRHFGMTLDAARRTIAYQRDMARDAA